jgi:inner membrane protein
MGEAFAGKKLGRKAMVWGLIAQSFPDIDFVAATWLDTPSDLLAHRGFTHSILFAVMIALIMAALANKWHRPHNISFTRWLFFFGAVILSHIFIDAFNNYGVGWFEPFSHYRVSFNTIYVADPFFSAAPGIAFIMLLLLKSRIKKRTFWWKFGLSISALYLCYCTINKIIINHDVKKLLAKEHVPYTRYLTTPAPLQSWLWFVAAGNDSNYYVGYRSVFDKKQNLPLQKFARNTFLLDTMHNKKEVQKLIRFSQQFYTIEKKQDTLIFNDLRFGQIIGWKNPKEEFVFYYYLYPDIDNTLVVQRGRFAKWNWPVIKSLVKRIAGN